jgi:4-diphosphocytidyl-2-C-methyl-D-erythritol kinase
LSAASGSRVVEEAAPAKLNLYLHVTRIREDGYHELDSLFAFAEIGDRLAVSLEEDLLLSVDGPFADAVPSDADNLVLRAARALGGGEGRGAHLRLTKNLPVASGIGGGSADAAAALRGLNHLWELGLSRDELARIGATLGADIPACVLSRPLQVSGIGETLRDAVPLPDCRVVLINPGVEISTPAVFCRFDAAVSSFRQPAPLGPCGTPQELADALARRANDLEPPAMAMSPAIGTVLDALSRASGCLVARMSGSGATCFGLFAGQEAAIATAEGLRRDHPEWWIAEGALLAGGR